MKSKLTTEEMIQLHHEGWTRQEIGAKAGITHQAVQQHLAKAGVTGRSAELIRLKAEERWVHIDEAGEESRWKERYLAGESLIELATPTQNRRIVREFLVLAGVEIRDSIEAARNRRMWDFDEIVRLYESGKSSIEICEELGCHTPTVTDALAEAGVDARWVSGGRIPDEIGAEMREQFDDFDYMLKDIAKAFGYSTGAAIRSIRRARVKHERI